MDLNIKGLRLAAKQKVSKCPRTMVRLLAMIELAKRTRSNRDLRGLDYERVAAEFGKSTRTIKRWKNGWEENGIRGLVPKASPGRRRRPINGFTAKKIREFRKKYNWGAEVIGAHLKLDFGQIISEGRIHRFLLSKGMIKSKKRKPKSRHTRIVKVIEPGAHTQSDVKHLPHILLSEEKCYVYNFVDHASKTEFKRAYLSCGAFEMKDFAERVIKEIPFSISRWQTDNGIEVTYKYVTLIDKPKKHAFDKVCDKNNIRHVLIPPGEKELQGLVERNHRMDDNELYHRIRPRDINEFNRYLEAHYKWRNSSRRRKILGWKTPNEWLKDYGTKILSGLVRQKDPVESVDLLPNDNRQFQQGWEKILVEVWSHMDKAKINHEANHSQTRQNFIGENKNTEAQAQSVGDCKKAA